MHLKTNLRKQNGAALLITLMVLALLTLLGMAVTSAALVETCITRNETVRDLAFYQAESGWQYGLFWLESQPGAIREDLGSLSAPSGWAEAFSSAAAGAPQNLDAADGQSSFAVSIHYLGTSQPPLYSTDFRRIDYSIHARGYGPLQAQSLIEVSAGRIIHGDGY
ncbi:PilX N-terminal [Geoalkalibacter ferrihydriticus]|uniref:Type 4 fimbrial biogenesis protein PilX N-terminal domain-containing protein n=2 Tax=Geoalkalibacter ferrihydriticus TaxID=392333 RepID=A0A0C2HK96_9BACT|nr:PilX N-terminal domain-containing pilus assembly protein [Geoalkalibacter ferrihydriticus]KIH75445.1 hypothetical protein GFER_16845 [Geoalkalibacter ferrihydriticus DSM 17813]SDM93699.1 PilX N-terminal [Geoalkalibacter ferrihydriticus]